MYGCRMADDSDNFKEATGRCTSRTTFCLESPKDIGSNATVDINSWSPKAKSNKIQDPSNNDSKMMIDDSNISSFHLDDVLGLIEEGVALIGAKKYNQACVSLTQALQINKEMLLSDVAHSLPAHQEKHDDEQRNCDEESLSSQILSTLITRTTSTMVSLGDRLDGSLTLQEGNSKCKIANRSIYVYSTPLSVMACDQGSELFHKAKSHDVQTILSVVIIFNLALTNHLCALDQMSNGGCSSLAKRRCLLGRAFALYQHCKALQYQLNLESCWFFSLMIINNEAQVLTLIGEHQQAEELLQGMLSGLFCLNRHYREDQHHDSSLPPIACLEGFSHNTSYLILKEVITAAAA